MGFFCTMDSKKGASVGVQADFKVPMLAKSTKLKRLPGQDPNCEYGIVSGACREPGKGWGYVFEFTGKRRGHFLAWMTEGGAVYACHEPLAYVPEGEPDVLVSRTPEDENAGQIEARTGSELPLRMVSNYRRAPRTGTFSFEKPANDMGVYAGASLDLRTFLAVSFLAFVRIPQVSGVAAPRGLMGDVVDDLLKPPLPDACDMVVHRVRAAQPGAASGFELYAARLLEEAGAARLRPLVSRAEVSATRLSSTGLAWLRFDERELNPEERSVVLAVESAINRLALIEDSVEAIDGAGTLYAGYGEGFCSEQDWRALCGIASGAAYAVQGCERGNDLCEIFGVRAAQGGEWDVRTRFARTCEELRLPFRLEYRFDCDAAAGVLAVEYSVPTPSLFPDSRWDAAHGTWVDMRPLQGWAASAYGLRLAALLAAAAFGAGIGIVKAYVTARVGFLEGPAGISLAFDRIAFVSDVLPRIATGAFDAEHLACDPGAVLALLEPTERSTAFLDNGFFGTVHPLTAAMAQRRPPLWEDTRALPDPLVGVLRAAKACELDVLHDEDATVTACANDAMEGAESTPLASIATLEGIVAQLDERERDAAEMDNRIPLYCSSPVARILVGLIDAGAQTRYRKASDAAFAARSGLSRLYLQIHDVPRAIEAAEACIALAPTSLPGYLDAVAAYMEAERFAEAESVLLRALRVALGRADRAYVRYRLAYALWMQGCLDLALASYVTVAEAGGAFAVQAESELADLMEQMGVRERPSSEAAASKLSDYGVSLAAPREAMELVAQAAVGLVDAGILNAAAPLTHALAALVSNDVLSAVANSLEGDVPLR